MPEVVVTTAVASPAVRGWWTPQILIPVAMATAADATLDAMLLHELIHVRRRDLLTVAVAEALAIVHWFNPLFRLAVTRVRALNEFGCDAAVVALPGAEAAGYRHVLLEHAAALAGVQTAPADLRLATAFAGPGAEIVARLQALERARPGARPPKLAAAAAAMLTLACVAPMGRLPGPAVSAGSGAAVTCGDAPFTQQARDTLDRHLAGERVGCLRLRAAAVQLWNPATQDFDQGTQP